LKFYVLCAWLGAAVGATGCVGDDEPAPAADAAIRVDARPLSCASSFTVTDAGGLTAVSSCTEIGGSLTIRSKDIVDLAPLRNLSAIGGFLLIDSNSVLTSLAGLEALASVGERIKVVFNPVLTDISALGGLTAVNGSLEIAGNKSLPSVDGLTGLASVIGQLEIADNPVLANLAGLSGLGTVAGAVRISKNSALGSLGLDALGPPGWYLLIEDNIALPTCAAVVLQTQVEALGFTGPVLISGNDDTGTCM
jgi:hypothetical protein